MSEANDRHTNEPGNRAEQAGPADRMEAMSAPQCRAHGGTCPYTHSDRSTAKARCVCPSLGTSRTIGFFRTTPEGEILAVNEGLAAILGYGSAKEFCETVETMADVYLYPQQRRVQVAASLAAASKPGHTPPVLTNEYEWKRKDGSPVWVRTDKAIISTSDGSPLYFEGFLLDISKERASRQELIQAKEELEAIFENSQVGVALLRGGRYFARVNQSFTNIFGYSQEEVLGKSVSLVHISHQSFVEFGKAFYTTLVNDGRRTVEYRMRRKNGEEFWCELSGKALDLDNLDAGVIWVLSDISARKEAEELSEDVDRMTRHDMKTPLNAVVNLPKLLRLDGELTAEQEHYLNLIEDAGYRMLEMINNSLNLYKMERGEYTVQPEPIALVPIIDRIQSELVGLAGRRGIILELSESRGPVIALGEELLCYSIFSNLVKNALEAAPRDSTVSIHVSLEPCCEEIDCDKGSGDCARVRITNLGSVPPGLRSSFFDKYSTHGKEQGTGLGAYTAQKMARAQGGRVLMETDEERTTLTVCLPADWQRHLTMGE